MSCKQRNSIEFMVSKYSNLELRGCGNWWWSLYGKMTSRKFRLSRDWIGTRLISVKSPLGNMRVKRSSIEMLIEEFDGEKWRTLRSFFYDTFVEVYPMFKMRHGHKGITFYLKEA